jgi:AcrR family transcriptional regulator
MSMNTRGRIRCAALGEFCEKGYGASVDDIARRAGVVKQTLYHHYGSKDELFREALIVLAEDLFVELESSSGPLREDLLRFAESYRAKTLNEQGVALFRMLIAEAPRFPELLRTLFEAGQVASHGLARRLQQAMALGEMRPDDAGFAASMLLSMLGGKERDLLLLGLPAGLGGPAARTERIVQLFLQAYAPTSAPFQGNPR